MRDPARDAQVRLFHRMSGRVSDIQMDGSWGPMIGGEDGLALGNLIAGLEYQRIPISEEEADLIRVAADGDEVDLTHVWIWPTQPDAPYYIFSSKGPDAPLALDAAMAAWAADNDDVLRIVRSRRIGLYGATASNPDTWVYVALITTSGSVPIYRELLKGIMYDNLETCPDCPVEVFVVGDDLPSYQTAAVARSTDIYPASVTG